ncbi:MAG: hypothetical protein ACL7BU_10820 [Candidatus Phlomobacter fragariae]
MSNYYIILYINLLNIIFIISKFLSRALNTADVVTIMTQAAGGVGLLVIIFSTLCVNDINLYSLSLSILPIQFQY